jgi:hypothetical protein
MSRSFSLTIVAVLLAACSKDQPAPTPAASETAAVTSAAPTPTPSIVTANATASTTASAAPATSGSAGAADCGSKENPCPLQGWMRENVNPPMNKHDMPNLAVALDKIAGFAPSGYTNWASISKDGAAAARSGDESAAKASCRSCHDQYKQKYKTELRGRKI